MALGSHHRLTKAAAAAAAFSCAARGRRIVKSGVSWTPQVSSFVMARSQLAASDAFDDAVKIARLSSFSTFSHDAMYWA